MADVGNYTIERRPFYWVFGGHEGGFALLGPYNSEEEAHEKGMEKLDGDFQVVALKTRNETKATRLIRGKYLNQGGNLSTALKPMSHKIPPKPGQSEEL